MSTADDTTRADSESTPDPFDELRADTSPIPPPAHVAARLRATLDTELERLMSTTDTTATSTVATSTATSSAGGSTARRRMPADVETLSTVTPYLTVSDAAAAIDFYVDAFGAVEHHRLVEADGRIGHAEIVIGNSRLALADEYPDYDAIAPTTRGGTSTKFTISTPDVETLESMVARAIELGATLVRPIADQFYGHRMGMVLDPFGHQWSIGTPIPGFDDDRYREQSAEFGLELRTADTPSTTDATSAATDHQVKHHVRGDLYYFTLQVPDLARAQRFYGAVLGWEFADPDHGHATNITAPPGGVQQVDDPSGPQLWFVVDDIHAAVAAVRAAGGTADDPVHYESGWSADCTDDQGVRFSLSVPTYTR